MISFDDDMNTISFPDRIQGFPNFGHIVLVTMPNTRDLGGMPTTDGRHIAYNRLIRSGELHNIADTDALSILGSLNVRRVIDLRTQQEASSAPDDNIVYDCAEYYHLPVFNSDAIGITRSQDLTTNISTLLSALGDLKQTVSKSYEDALFKDMGIQAYKDMMNIIAEAGDKEGATLWHCSAGKDRTGIGAMLIECALGVSEENIRRDYLATNIFSYKRNDKFPYCLAPLAKELAGIDITPLFYVYPEYYDSIMKRIEKECGSLEGYIRDVLNIRSDVIEQLRRDYLIA